jgi:hypothetical protein
MVQIFMYRTRGPNPGVLDLKGVPGKKGVRANTRGFCTTSSEMTERRSPERENKEIPRFFAKKTSFF